LGKVTSRFDNLENRVAKLAAQRDRDPRVGALRQSCDDKFTNLQRQIVQHTHRVNRIESHVDNLKKGRDKGKK
jgi:hypothetical protein